MNTASKIAVTVLFLTFLSGCEKKTKTTPPPQAQAPVLPTSKMVHVPELPPLPPPSQRDVAVANTEPENPEPARPHRTTRHKPSPAKPTAPADAGSQSAEKSGQTTQNQVAANPSTSAASDVSPIGQLSSSGDAGSSQGRGDIEKLINDTENGLNRIKRTLSSEEQLTSTQIKTFLAKSKQALADNDLDGAQTLAQKAKVLLEELTKK